MGCVQARVSEWSLSTLPSPIPKLQHAPLPLKVLWTRERAPTPPYFVVFYLGSHLNPLRSWECVTISMGILLLGMKYQPHKTTCWFAQSFVVHRIKAIELRCLLGSWRRRMFEPKLSCFSKSFKNIFQSMDVQLWGCAHCKKYSSCFLVTPTSFPTLYFLHPFPPCHFYFFLILNSSGLLFILFLKIYYRVVIKEHKIFMTKISSF